jgi:carbon monoxide dehydrogenase subunit G
MRRVVVRRKIDAPIETVWDALADIESHVEWMADARAIRFTSERTEGVGTTFDCDTKVGPLRLVDKMEVTEWTPEQAMAVRHIGLVTGEGRFTLFRARSGTVLSWEEQLQFPWWIPSIPAAMVLRAIWRGNLRRFERTLGLRAPRGARLRVRRRRRAG